MKTLALISIFFISSFGLANTNYQIIERSDETIHDILSSDLDLVDEFEVLLKYPDLVEISKDPSANMVVFPWKTIVGGIDRGICFNGSNPDCEAGNDRSRFVNGRFNLDEALSLTPGESIKFPQFESNISSQYGLFCSSVSPTVKLSADGSSETYLWVNLIRSEPFDQFSGNENNLNGKIIIAKNGSLLFTNEYDENIGELCTND